MLNLKEEKKRTTNTSVLKLYEHEKFWKKLRTIACTAFIKATHVIISVIFAHNFLSENISLSTLVSNIGDHVIPASANNKLRTPNYYLSRSARLSIIRYIKCFREIDSSSFSFDHLDRSLSCRSRSIRGKKISDQKKKPYEITLAFSFNIAFVTRRGNACFFLAERRQEHDAAISYFLKPW